jgi:glycosyltransferase involved in cell wall biosynthesis
MKQQKPVRVLYLHPAAAFGGASKSLVELYRAFSEESVKATVLCPSGQAAEQFRATGMEVVECIGLAQWDNTRFGHYRGKRWLVLLREWLLWIPTIFALLRVARRGKYDLIHANEITLLPVAILARKILRLPLVVHVRSLQRMPESGRITDWINRMLSSTQAVIAIDRTVARTLPESLRIQVIHNGIRAPEDFARDDLPRDILQVAMVGGLLRMKGVYEFVEAAKICRDRGLSVRFLLAGENPRNLKGIMKWLTGWADLAHDVRSDLESYIAQNNLGKYVELLGFVRDVGALYRKIDLLCFPSYLDAAGRPVFEAAFHGVPSLVAADSPEPDTIIHGETGLCIPPRNPLAIADAVELLANRRGELRRMGGNARRLAMEHFDIERNAKKVFDLYLHLAEGQVRRNP